MKPADEIRERLFAEPPKLCGAAREAASIYWVGRSTDDRVQRDFAGCDDPLSQALEALAIENAAELRLLVGALWQ